MIIRSDNRVIEDELKALEKSVVDNGGRIHPNLTIAYNEETGLSVYMEPGCPSGEVIINIPENLLIPQDDINLSIRGNEFVVDPNASVLSPVQLEITRCLISIYNLTDKVEFHKNEYPWIRFRKSPGLLYQLLRARTLNDTLNSRQRFLYSTDESEAYNDYVVGTFCATRVVGFKHSGEGKIRRYFMPVIDFINHDYRGSIFIPADNDKGGRNLHIQNRQPYSDNQECYAFYGMYDGLDMFLSYGFYDQAPPFIRSVPMEIEIEDLGKVIVCSHMETDYKNKMPLPSHMKDLKNFMPSINKLDNGNFEISYLFITLKRFRDDLRRILTIIIRSFSGKDKTQKFVLEQTKYAEEAVINSNIEFYKTLMNKLDENKTADAGLVSEIRRIAECQLAKLDEYVFDEAYYLKPERHSLFSAAVPGEADSTI